MKRDDRLRGLSDDHHTALVVAVRCKRAEESALPALWRSVLEGVRTHFEPHFRIEEEHLLPALARIGEAEMVSRIEDEHARLRELTSLREPTLEQVRDFGRLLERHVRFEEREVFESTQERLPVADLDALAAACEAQPRTCPASLFAPAPAGAADRG